MCIDKVVSTLWECLMQHAVWLFQALSTPITGVVGAITYTTAAAMQSGETQVSWSVS